jgi:16S rRNA processing protein RimM
VFCGRIVGVFGIRGEVKVVSYTEPEEQLLIYRPWQLRLTGREAFPVQPTGAHRRGHMLVVALDGFSDRTRSETLVGGEISVPRQCFPPLPDGQFYWVDLLGLEVVDEAGTRLGRVSDLTRGPAGDCLAVTGTPPLLIPFVWKSTVLSVELESHRIRIRSAEETLPGAF